MAMLSFKISLPSPTCLFSEIQQKISAEKITGLANLKIFNFLFLCTDHDIKDVEILYQDIKKLRLKLIGVEGGITTASTIVKKFFCWISENRQVWHTEKFSWLFVKSQFLPALVLPGLA